MKTRIALIQNQAYATPDESAFETEKLMDEAASRGANIICTQELFLTEYFCWKQSEELFDYATIFRGGNRTLSDVHAATTRCLFFHYLRIAHRG